MPPDLGKNASVSSGRESSVRYFPEECAYGEIQSAGYYRIEKVGKKTLPDGREVDIWLKTKCENHDASCL